jgi:hypothetical protein
MAASAARCDGCGGALCVLYARPAAGAGGRLAHLPALLLPREDAAGAAARAEQF